MKLSTFREAKTDDILAHTIIALETLKQVSGAVSAVPFLGAVVGSALSLICTVEASNAHWYHVAELE